VAAHAKIARKVGAVAVFQAEQVDDSRWNSPLRQDLLGVPFIIAGGSALHFAFSWADEWPPLAIVAATNESIWEHLKLAFWPSLVWALIESRRVGLPAQSYWAAKGVSFLVAPIVIVVVFQSYTAILGRNLLVLDIGTFVVAVVLGQLGSIWLLTRRPVVKPAAWVGIALLLCQLAAFSLLTYVPPNHPLFIDPRSGAHGLSETQP